MADGAASSMAVVVRRAAVGLIAKQLGLELISVLTVGAVVAMMYRPVGEEQRRISATA